MNNLSYYQLSGPIKTLKVKTYKGDNNDFLYSTYLISLYRPSNTAVYSFNSVGNLLEYHIYDSRETLQQYNYFKYNKAGKLREHIYSSHSSLNPMRDVIYYDENEDCVRIENYFLGKILYSISHSVTDSKGSLQIC